MGLSVLPIASNKNLLSNKFEIQLFMWSCFLVLVVSSYTVSTDGASVTVGAVVIGAAAAAAIMAAVTVSAAIS